MKRAHLLAGALVATLAAAWWATGLDEEGPAPQRAARKAVRRDVAAPLNLDGLSLLPRESAAPPRGGDQADLFAPRSFVPPPPPEPAAVPTPPPLPFRYSGMLDDGGPPAVFLAHRDEIRVVRAGDVLDGHYRVSAVSRARVDFIYLPLNASQSLLTGALP